MRTATSTSIVRKIASSVAMFLVFGVANVQALTISPARLEMYGDPGKTISGEFLLINEQENNQTFYTSAENFEAQGETSTPNFVSGTDGLASWIEVRKEVTLHKGEQVKVPFTVTIPKDADAGGHFAAIFLSTVPPASKGAGEVAVGAKVGMLVLLKVSGEVKEGGGIVDFTTKTKKSFFTSLPITFAYRFSNNGNDRVNPTGDAVITNMLGLEKVKLPANQGLGNVLPKSTRRFEIVWGNDAPQYPSFFDTVQYQASHFALGYYHVSLNLSYGVSSKASESLSVFVFPWQLMIVTLLGALAIYFIVSRLLKRYNRWIISQATHQAKE